MAFVPPREKSFFEKNWPLFLLIFIIFLVLGMVFWFISQEKAKALSFEKLNQIHSLRSALSLYYFYFDDYPPAGEKSEKIVLGQGQNRCLERTFKGFNNNCQKDLLIFSPLPRFEYLKKEKGSYQIFFQLEKGLANLQDKNKNGKIECEATPQTITCN